MKTPFIPAALERPLHWVTYLVYLAAVLILADYTAYLFYIDRYHAANPPPGMTYIPIPGVDPLLVKRLGLVYAKPKKADWFTHFKKEKKAGTVRIGCLGDSFTYGDETADGADFPALLQKKFSDNGAGNVEVLNFGFSWRGFAETFLVWEQLARQYDLDYVLLGPRTFYPERLNTFSHAGEMAPFYIHSRYILAPEGPKLLDIPGGDAEETFRNYNSFIPSLSALRYDLNPPAFIRALLPDGRTLKNPFYYYRGDPREEAVELHTELLKKMAEGARQVLVVCSAYAEFACPKDPGKPNVRLTEDPLAGLETFPYKMPRGHYSPAANLALAGYWYDFITGKSESSIPILLPAAGAASFPSASPVSPATDVFDSAEILHENAVIGELRFFTAKDTTVPQRNFRARSLLAIKSGPWLCDPFFVALELPVHDGMMLYVESDDASGGDPVLISKVKTMLDGIFGAAELAPADPELTVPWTLKLPENALVHRGAGSPIKIKLGERTILHGTLGKDGAIENIVPADGCALGRIRPDKAVAFKPAAETGTFFIRFRGIHGDLTVPLADWKREILRVRFWSGPVDARPG